ncbi:hypothetical protein RRG08_018625 [Elysia crispata]|uniref:Uncharacterized protein n=1 Tax=Elysia crispata TaxID=231223 RepID=A0AAE1D7P4_9GAST|nr:hypothetical protein RRG08_018625 [Elysia crispata]
MSIDDAVVLYVISAPFWPIFSNQENMTFDLVSLAFVLCSFLSLGLIIIPERKDKSVTENSCHRRHFFLSGGCELTGSSP